MTNPANSTTNVEKILQCSGLNEDCLVEILKYLSVCELLVVCDLDDGDDKSITNLINDRVIIKTFIDFDQIQSGQSSWSVNRVFEQFGQSMKRLKVLITSITFNHFLRKVVRYCRPDRLSELEIVINTKYVPLHVDNVLWEEVQQKFRRLTKFTLKRTLKSPDVNQNNWMSEIVNQLDLPHLEVLALQRLWLTNTWLGLFPNRQMCANITELRLMNVSLHENINDFQKFLNQFPNLEVFIHTGGEQEFTVVAERVHHRFPNLRGFGCSINNISPFDEKSAFDKYFNVLTIFTNLTEFHIDVFGQRFQHVDAIIRFVPNIKVLAIWQILDLYLLPVGIRRIVQAIRKTITNRRERFPANDRIHLLVNQYQFNEFKVIKNIDDIIRLTVIDFDKSIPG